MISTLVLLLFLTVLALSGVVFVLQRRASRARQELAQSLHDKALALDRRCDAIQQQLATEMRRQRIDHLLDLVRLCERQGELEAEAARRLERYVLELRQDAQVPVPPGDAA